MSDPTGVDLLPTLSVDLRAPSVGDSSIKLNGEPLRGVQAITVELDVESLLPKVTLVLVAKQVQLELPKVQVDTTRPVIVVSELTKKET